MEASFKSRVEHVFGSLLGSSSLVSAPILASGTPSATNAWSVSEVVIPYNHGSSICDESSESEDDEPCAARYEEFVQLSKRSRKRQDAEDTNCCVGEGDMDEDRVVKRRRSTGLEGEQGSNGILAGDLDEEEECSRIRLMVGMDDTLDFEEEEDEYDKVAVGREEAGERYFMGDIRGGGSSSMPLPLTKRLDSEQRQITRDIRANHAAAAARLEEDDRLAPIKSSKVVDTLRMEINDYIVSFDQHSGPDVKMHPLPMSDTSLISNLRPALKKSGNSQVNGALEIESSTTRQDQEGSSSNYIHGNEVEKSSASGEPGGNLQNSPIDSFVHIKQSKVLRKVRFAGCKDDPNEDSISARKRKKRFTGPLSKRRSSWVPDHVRNPSKYTYYSLEWSDEEDENKKNLAAFQETLALTCSSKIQEAAVELPKSITFTPRSGGGINRTNGKAGGSTAVCQQRPPPLVSFDEEEAMTENGSSQDETLQTISESRVLDAKTTRVFRKQARTDDADDTKTDEKTDNSV